MAQNDNHLYSAFKRPRETIGGFGSSIPQPSSSRRSLAPNAMPPPRMSMVPQPRFSTVGGSLQPEPPMSALKSARKSYAPGSATPSSAQQPPGSASARRTSAFSRPSGFGGAGSFFQSNILSTGVVKDPRPLRDRAFLTKMAQELLEYLAMNNFELDMKHQISPNFLKSPTQKDFNTVFEWLYRRIDPNYRFAKMDQEILPILKTLRYPYSNSITKSSLAAVGGANTWPTFLGMLHWMLELVKTMDKFDAGVYEDAVEGEPGSDVADVAGERIVFDFVAKSYQAWLQNDDDHRDFVEEMVAAFDDRVAQYESDAAKYEQLNADLAEQIRSLDNTDPATGKTKLQTLQDAKRILDGDKTKFINYMNDIAAHIQKTRAANERLRAQLADQDEQLATATAERAQLQRAVDRQGLTPADIDRMTSEREKLDKGLAAAAARLAELKIRVADKEAEAASRLEHLERAVTRYNSLAYQIGIIPSSAHKAHGKEFELVLFSNRMPQPMQIDDGDASTPAEDVRLLVDSVTGYQPAQIANRNLRHDVKPALNRLRQEIGDKIHEKQDESFRNVEAIDREGEAVSELADDLETLKARVAAAQAELDGIKETMTAESNASNTEIEKLERELQNLRIGLNNGMLSLDQRLQSVTIEWDQLQHSANALRQDLHAEVERALNDIIKFKLHIQEGLSDFEKKLEDEVGVAARVEG